MSKITRAQEEKLRQLKDNNSAWGDKCPCCNRFYVYEYEDGSKVCSKCDELVEIGCDLIDTTGGNAILEG